jgi:hypothetical protein
LIDPAALRRGGGIALWIGAEGTGMLTVREKRGERAWVR